MYIVTIYGVVQNVFYNNSIFCLFVDYLLHILGDSPQISVGTSFDIQCLFLHAMESKVYSMDIFYDRDILSVRNGSGIYQKP